MNVFVNSKETSTEYKTILELANELSLPEKGVAVAVDNKIVPRAEWATSPLKEGAQIVIIKAACGG